MPLCPSCLARMQGPKLVIIFQLEAMKGRWLGATAEKNNAQQMEIIFHGIFLIFRTITCQGKLQGARTKVRKLLRWHITMITITFWQLFGTIRKACLCTFRKPWSFSNNITISSSFKVITNATWIYFTRIFLSDSALNEITKLSLHDFFWFTSLIWR